MKIVVPVKRVIDCNVKLRAKSDGASVDLANGREASFKKVPVVP